ncbi:hypothetical protein [Actinomadura livida]|uniref:Cytochrome c-type biogenesis protein CcmH/NrfG n=2 Tax=Actinomadura livida TaxID=79909 RepID=A0A7W7IKR6_9ACTN|nr:MULTISPECIES: hypothetical protein [Actinomadura]MBB4778870.1 cytochrome c-type biogenesis protein CcmH/NrfG [Actinomadura catellatispora]
MKKLTMAVGAVALSGALTLTAVPAQAAPEPKPEIPESVIQQLPAPLQAEVRENPGDIGWDENGPYIVWGNLACRIHLFLPWEWAWAWGTGPCWF